MYGRCPRCKLGGRRWRLAGRAPPVPATLKCGPAPALGSNFRLCAISGLFLVNRGNRVQGALRSHDLGVELGGLDGRSAVLLRQQERRTGLALSPSRCRQMSLRPPLRTWHGGNFGVGTRGRSRSAA